MAAYTAVPSLTASHQSRGYGVSTNTGNGQNNTDNNNDNSVNSSSSDSKRNSDIMGLTGVADFAQVNPTAMVVPHKSTSSEDVDAVPGGRVKRSSSRASQVLTAAGGGTVSRSSTLKKKGSTRRTGSLKRSNSRRSLQPGGLKGLGDSMVDNDDFNSAFSTPVPTSDSPTDILANRFQAWRQLLKSLITYFREIQNSYDTRAKALHKVQTTLANITHPAIFLSENGLGDATRILDDYHTRSVAEANKSKKIENDVIAALTGLRSDLGQKIKEIKSLSGDFKNSVEKEKDGTRKEVEKLQEALQHLDHEDGGANVDADPFVVRLGVDRAVEKQIDEENYLHRAYLNLENSGRELESIVVGEIQKAYNALAGILKREGDDAYHAVESLRTGPIAMSKDFEWYQFVTHDPHFVDPDVPLRRIEDIEYPGKHHPAAAEIRAGMLERKSKYLKSYTPGWYVLSSTHLHEFKSADKIYSQPPVMSLCLAEQKLGSHSERGSSSHKFMLKGKQSGGIHKGHNWVFRAESYDTMLAWFDDIRILTEKTGKERNAFVRRHARSMSAMSDGTAPDSDGLEEDEADQTPYSADVTNLAEHNPVAIKPQRPQPGGRFPSDMALREAGTMKLSTTDGSDGTDDDNASTIPGAGRRDYGGKDPYRPDGIRPVSSFTACTGVESYEENTSAADSPLQEYSAALLGQQVAPVVPLQTLKDGVGSESQQPVYPSMSLSVNGLAREEVAPTSTLIRHNSARETSGWMAPAAATTAVGPVADAVGKEGNQDYQGDVTVSAPDDRAAAGQVPRAPVPSAYTLSASSAGPAISSVAKSVSQTGEILPHFSRNDTEISVSNLYVPGKFPERASE